MPNTPTYGRGQVVDIINSVIHKMGTGKGCDPREIYHHLAELASIIDALKADIASTRPDHLKNSHIPDATDELGAVVSATAEATNSIMTVCEDIEAFAQTLDQAKGEELTAKVTQIYEACTFQDITGQRIKNVITTFKVIEDKIDKIMETLGDAVGLKAGGERYEKAVSVDDAKSLLNGPQMADKAISQDDIDKLLAEFDK